MKTGDQIISIYGKIETVMSVEDHRVTTYESARRLCWYHPTKVFHLDGSAFVKID
jgi:hypothetical protein